MHRAYHNLFSMGEPWSEKIFRSVAVYLFLLIIIRLAGKREVGQVSTADLIVVLLLSNTVQNAIIGNETSLVGGLVGATVLILLNKIVVRAGYRFRGFGRLIDGEPLPLITDGTIQQDVLRMQQISLDELRAAVRDEGVGSLEDVDRATLETNGMISIIPRVTGSDAAIEERLERIETLINQLSERMQSNAAGA
jgi:uncharacterized membrane protein YcaP (DUF421 family)